MSVFGDDFIESVITPETETTNPSKTMEVTREFYGMEAVASFESQTPTEAYSEDSDSTDNGGDE